MYEKKPVIKTQEQIYNAFQRAMMNIIVYPKSKKSKKVK